MLTVAAFTGVFLAEDGGEDADGREVLNSSGGGGLLYWPLLATIVALMIPIGYEFFFAKDGMLQKYFSGCANWIATEDTNMLPLVDLHEADDDLLEWGPDPHSPISDAEPRVKDDDEALEIARAETADTRVELVRVRAQMAALTHAKDCAAAK